MKIINKPKFIKLPPYTLYSIYSPCHFGDLSVKSDSTNNSFYSISLNDPVEFYSSEQFVELLENASKTGESVNTDLESYYRDSDCNDNQLYAIWEKQDLLKLQELIGKCLENLK
jgi:hypothetical protein